MTAGTSGDGRGAADDERAVRDLNSEFYAAVEECDLDRMAAVWVDGDLASGAACVHAGWPMLRGREEVLRSWALIMANTLYIQYILTDVAVDLCGEIAVLTCSENILTGVGAAGDDASGGLLGGRMVATNVYRRTGNGWRLWLHHGSPVLDQAETEEPEDVDEAGGDGFQEGD
jgi:ketosteroid isomerase-like protein